jgi:hypothetical protein
MVHYAAITRSGAHRNTVEFKLYAAVDSYDRADEFVDFLKGYINNTPEPSAAKHILTLDIAELPSIPFINPFIVAKLVSAMSSLAPQMSARFDTCYFRVPNTAYKLASTAFLNLFVISENETIRCFSYNEKEQFEAAKIAARNSRCARELKI